jgi:hypothetical protein
MAGGLRGRFRRERWRAVARRREFHAGFQTGETGTYTVNTDCTGHAEIDLNVPVPIGPPRVIKLLFVLSNQGRRPTVVAEFTPGATAPVLSTTRSDGFKVGGDDQ